MSCHVQVSHPFVGKWPSGRRGHTATLVEGAAFGGQCVDDSDDSANLLAGLDPDDASAVEIARLRKNAAREQQHAEGGGSPHASRGRAEARDRASCNVM